jgi:hypothetical protein
MAGSVRRAASRTFDPCQGGRGAAATNIGATPTKEEVAMAEQPTRNEADAPEERIPAFQHVLDNPFLLLFLGVALPTVLYILWGVMEIATVPISPLAK